MRRHSRYTYSLSIPPRLHWEIYLQGVFIDILMPAMTSFLLLGMEVVTPCLF